jgi:hypothetical protein
MAADYTGTRPPQTTQANPVLLHRLLGIGLMTLAVAMVIARHSLGDAPAGSRIAASWRLSPISLAAARTRRS